MLLFRSTVPHYAPRSRIRDNFPREIVLETEAQSSEDVTVEDFYELEWEVPSVSNLAEA